MKHGGCMPSKFLIDYCHKLGEVGDTLEVDKERYQRLIENLIYFGHSKGNIAHTIRI